MPYLQEKHTFLSLFSTILSFLRLEMLKTLSFLWIYILQSQKNDNFSIKSTLPIKRTPKLFLQNSLLNIHYNPKIKMIVT